MDKIGLDAVLLQRFLRMLRNIFLVLTAIGCGILIPINYFGGAKYDTVATLTRFTPQYIYGGNRFWAFVAVAYMFQATICVFIWWNYRAVFRLRRTYFESKEYKASLHSRTLLVGPPPQA